MEYKVIVTHRAAVDFDEIMRFIARESPMRALQFGDRLYHAVRSLAEQPRRGNPVQKSRGVRKLLLSPYNIYYSVSERERVVEILRFWHTARDPKRLRFD